MAAADVCGDIERLHPAFRARVEAVLAIMRSKGWNPVVYETLRTPERAALLKKRGRSKNGALSMHCQQDDQGRVGAVDIVDADLRNVPRMTKEGLWDAPPKFWADLEDAAESVELHRLYKVKHEAGDGDAESWDKPHVQCVPATPKAQNAYRALTPRARGEFLAKAFPISAAA